MIAPIGADEQCLKDARGCAGACEQVLQRERALRDVGRVLQQSDVAGRQRGRGEADDLPERKIPRHHRQHSAQRLKEDGVSAVRLDVGPQE
jgi:hypothetical protein